MDYKSFIHDFGDSDRLEHGDAVYCVGYPDYALGSIDYTSGEITNILADVNRFGETVRYYIGTDADISAGNSGGAAVNRDGKLIGLPTLGFAGTGGFRGYITPIKQARWLLGKWVKESNLGASITGRILSAQTGEGIIGADILILWPGENVRNVMALLRNTNRTEEDNMRLNYSVFAYCKSVINGRFQLDHLLPSGYRYSVIVLAAHYEVKTAQDWLNIDRAGERNITLELVRH